MVKHTRTDIIKPLIESGHIKEFRQIFIYVPKTAVAEDLGIHFNRFNGFFGESAADEAQRYVPAMHLL